MPAMESSNLPQYAVLWPWAGTDDYAETLRGDPEEIRCNWDDRQSLAMDAQGNSVRVDATVIVAGDIDAGSIMWLGRLSEWLGTGSAGDDTELMEVATSSKTPDDKGRNYVRKLGLTFYRDELPEEAS